MPQKDNDEVLTGAEGHTPAAVKSGEGNAGAGASVPSPALWPDAGGSTVSDLQRKLPRGCGICLPKKKVVSLVG